MEILSRLQLVTKSLDHIHQYPKVGTLFKKRVAGVGTYLVIMRWVWRFRKTLVCSCEVRFRGVVNHVIWVFYIGNTEKCHFLAFFCNFEPFNNVFMKFLSWVKLFIRIWYTFWKKYFFIPCPVLDIWCHL